jgi:small subunit ribosomal protein S3
MRLGITRTWDSRWFEKKHYVDWLHEDVAIRKSFNRWMRSASISKIEIERRANQARVIVNTAKPGIIIGKRGVGIDEIRKNLEALTGKSVAVNVMEIQHPELDARLVAQNIVDQLEKRIAFRRAMKQAIMRSMRAGARGIKVQVSGRLGGAEIARTEHNADGKVPLHTLRADIDYAQVEAFTTFGRIGVKVWIYRGEILPDQVRGGRGRGREMRPPMTPRPAVASPEAVAATPEPVVAAPEPVAAAQPIVAVEPMLPAPQPVAVAPEPVGAAPEPVAEAAASEPVAAASEPVAAAPEPVAEAAIVESVPEQPSQEVSE